jgi:hypothetical protein
VQFQNIAGTELDNFRDGKGETVLWPNEYKNGDAILPIPTSSTDRSSRHGRA